MFESRQCGRCGGSGHYSFNMIHGTMCYGCGGCGKQLTKLGKRQREAWLAELETPIEEIEIGHRIYLSGRWATVEEIRPGTVEDGRYKSMGMTEWATYRWVITTKRGRHLMHAGTAQSHCFATTAELRAAKAAVCEAVAAGTHAVC